MAVLFFLLSLVALYLWVRGWWFVGLLMCAGWIIFAHTPTFLQVVFIGVVSFTPFLTRLIWRNREAIHCAMTEDPKRSALL